MEYALFGLLAYLLGSIPTAVWVGKAKYGVDVREHGSMNAGATNTFRVLGKKPGIVVLLIDIIKGFVAVSVPLVASWYWVSSANWVNVQITCSLAVVIVHVFPMFADFKGGKGVATSLGIIIGLHPPAAGICLAVFLIVFMASKYVSLGAMTAACCFPVLLWLIFKVESLELLIFSCALSAAVIIAHRKNIRRLLLREENKMNLFKK